jgi:hypothetical protein
VQLCGSTDAQALSLEDFPALAWLYETFASAIHTVGLKCNGKEIKGG